MASWLEDETTYIENLFDDLGENKDLDIGVVNFIGKKNRNAFIIPSIHPGPFRKVGSSNLPFILSSELEKNIVVSDEFFEIYKNFNVTTQVEEMKALDKEELYLLLTLCLDKHDDTNALALSNFRAFADEIREILDLQEDKEVKNQYLLDLAKRTEDSYIETDNIVNSKGEKIPEPYTLQEVRDIKIGLIEKDSE